MEMVINSPKYGDHIVLVDESDYELVKGHKWRPYQSRRTYYATTRVYNSETKKSKHVFMHNMIMGAIGVDHINHSGLDNRRVNLRFATQRQNAKNMQVSVLNKFGLKGVSYCEAKNAYSSHITVDYKHKFLGYYSSVIEASDAYNKAAIELFKEFAQLNYITPGKEAELRLLDISDFSARRGKNKTRFRGVSSDHGRFTARKTYKGKTYFIGMYDTDIEASIAYNNFNVKEQYEKDHRGIAANS